MASNLGRTRDADHTMRAEAPAYRYLDSMFAKTFEGVLLRLLNGADLTSPDAEDMSTRFEALRGSGLLPRGRENRETRLTPEHLANAIMGLAAQRASWAAVACGALARYRPIGGADPDRFREPTLRALIARLVSDEPARKTFVRLRLSTSESSKNVHGAATAYFEQDGVIEPTSYLSEFAVSARMNGQVAFDTERRFAPASRDLVLTRAFFDGVARAVASSANIPEPEGDGREYDADDAHRARMHRLQIRPTAHVLNMAVDTHAAWPRTETMITFDGVRLILMPPTRETTTSIHVDLYGNGITSEAAQTVIRRFLSVLAWEDDQYAVLGHGWSGNTAPVAVSKPQPMFATAEPWLPPRRSPGEDRANRALAHYRAGRNADHAELVTYAVLSFYKVLEVRFRKSDQISTWIAKVLPDIRASRTDDELWSRFDKERGAESPEDYIRRAYRLAAAHASIGRPSDEDDTKELWRLTTGADVLRQLARRLITEELHVPTLLAAEPSVTPTVSQSEEEPGDPS